MNRLIRVFVLSLTFFVLASGSGCDDPPANQGIPPKAKKSKTAQATQTTVASTSPSPSKGSDPLAAKLKANPTDATLLFEKAEAELRSNAPKKAMSTLRTLLGHHPEHERAYMKLASLLSTEGKSGEALRILEEGIEKVAQPTRLLAEAAKVQAKAGMLAKSNATIERLCGIVKAPAKERLAYARLLADLGAWKDSFAQFERVEKEAKLADGDKIVFARVLEALRMVDRALALLGCDVERPTPPRGAEGELRCGAMYTAKGDYKQADKHLKQAQSLEANDRSFYYLGQNDYARGSFDEAARHFKRASALNEKALDSKIGYAKSLRAMGGKHSLSKALRVLNDVVNAYGRFKTSLEMQSRDPQVFLERAEIYLQIKEDKRALADLATGLDIAPGDTRLTVAKAKALYYSRKTTKAMELLKGLLKDRPTEPEANFFLARMHLASAETGPAIKHFELSIKHGQGTFRDVFEAHSSLINLYKERNKRKKACEHMKRYLKTAPRGVTDREDIAEDIGRNCR